MLLQLLLVISCALATFAATPCAPRNFANGGMVCVCNITYCDTVDPVGTLGRTQFVSYTSNLAGLRFRKEEGVFEEPDPDDKNLIKIDHSITYQTIHGFGGAFTDAAGININSLNAIAKRYLLRSYFSEDGIEYNIGRVPIGGTDFSTRSYSYLDTPVPDTQLTNFALQDEDFNHKIPLILEALNMTNNQLSLFASAWTAPKWMKSNEEQANGGSLKPEYYQLWVDYFIKFLDAYGDEGIYFWGLTTGNEPSLAIFTFTEINTVGWLPSQQRQWVKENLGPTIRSSQYSDIKLIALDDQTLFLPLLSIFFDDAEVRNYIDGIGVHWYWNFLAPHDWLTKTHNEIPDKFIMNTEACRGERPWEEAVILGSWERGEDYATDIILDLQNWVTAWIDWNLALNMTGGPTYIDNRVDAAIIVDGNSFYKQPIYYAMGHFSKFITRDSVRVDIPTQIEGLLLVAFDRPDNLTTVVIINKLETNKSIILSDSNQGVIRMEVSGKSFNTIVYNNEQFQSDSAAKQLVFTTYYSVLFSLLILYMHN